MSAELVVVLALARPLGLLLACAAVVAALWRWAGLVEAVAERDR